MGSGQFATFDQVLVTQFMNAFGPEKQSGRSHTFDVTGEKTREFFFVATLLNSFMANQAEI